MPCSKSSDASEYANFLAWVRQVFLERLFTAIPSWNQVEQWRGKLVAVCDYVASYTAPVLPVWNEGYPVWWHLTNVHIMDTLIPCRGNVGMWRLPDNFHKLLKKG